MIDTLWSDWVELRVLLDIGSTAPSDTTFTLDDPINGQLDYATLGSPLFPFGDVSCDVRSLTWRFGATRNDGVFTKWEAGSAQVVLDNNRGQYPVGDDGSSVVPMAGLRIEGRILQGPFASGTFTQLFNGYVNSFGVGFDQATSDSTVTCNATDATALLAAYENRAVTPVGAGESASARVTRILNQAEWTGLRDIGPGGVALAATDLSGDAWSQLVAVNDAELGAVYIAPNGAATFVSRTDLYNKFMATDEPLWWFGPGGEPLGEVRYEDVVIAVDDSQLRNIVDAQRSGGAPQVVRRTDSVARFKPHRMSANVPLNLDADVLSWANFVLEFSELPTPRIESMVVMPRTAPADLWPPVITTKFGDHWRVTIDPVASATWAGVQRDVIVRGWECVVDRENWTVTYVLSDHSLFFPFILDEVTARLDIMRLSA